MPNKVLTAHLEEFNLKKKKKTQVSNSLKKNSRISDLEILELD